jgi:transposase-like protein
MAKARKKRMEYTAEQREKVLAAAKAENLTAAQVQKKFGVTPVTYYSWRKKSGVTRKRVTKRGARPVNAAVAVTARPVAGDLGAQVRAEVQNKMRQIIPGIVRTEVSAYLDLIFGVKQGPRRKKQ